VNAPFQPLFGARSLAEWIRAGGRPERRVQAYFARLSWHAFWFEHNWRTQTARVGYSELPDDPVFIVGPWRSGTTVMHELLAAVTGWRTPQTWQCFNPSTCFLAQRPPPDGVVERPMDSGRITTLGPQEDEFALLLLGEPSVYRAFVDPRRLRECAAELWPLTRDTLNKDTLPRWQHFLRGITAAAPGMPLLLKSPSHAFRLPLLRQLFPRARFVWMGRHTGELMASNLRMWRAMVDRYGLWACPEAAWEGFLHDMLNACDAVLARCLDEMPRDRLLWVDFHELRADRRRVLRGVLRFLNLDGSSEAGALGRRVEDAFARVPIHDGSRESLPADDSARKLEKRMVAARERFGLSTVTSG